MINTIIITRHREKARKKGPEKQGYESRKKGLLQKIDCIGFSYCNPKFNDSPCQCVRRTHVGIFRSDSIISRIVGNTGAICLEFIFFCHYNRHYGFSSAVLGKTGQGIPYLQIVSWSYLFMGFSQIYLCIMKNSGRTTKSTVYGSSALVLNILLNAILIFGLLGFPQMGIAGAALATTISRAAELFLTIFENVKTGVVRVRLKYFCSNFVPLKRDYYRYTMPVLANELVWGCGFTMFSVIMEHLGSDAVAANAVANIAKNMIACVCLGIGTGSGILVGNELGGGNLETARKYGRLLCKISLITGAVSGLFILLSSPLVLIFTTSLTEQAHAYLQIMLYICSYYMIGKSINSTVIAGIFCAGGDTKFGLICDAVTMWIIIIPLGAFAAFILHLPILAVYFLLNLDELIKLPAVYRHYKQYKWVTIS